MRSTANEGTEVHAILGSIEVAYYSTVAMRSIEVANYSTVAMRSIEVANKSTEMILRSTEVGN